MWEQATSLPFNSPRDSKWTKPRSKEVWEGFPIPSLLQIQITKMEAMCVEFVWRKRTKMISTETPLSLPVGARVPCDTFTSSAFEAG
jgi:hypothetical protein